MQYPLDTIINTDSSVRYIPLYRDRVGTRTCFLHRTHDSKLRKRTLIKKQ